MPDQIYSSQSPSLAVLPPAKRALVDPTSEDVNYPIGLPWLNETTNTLFYYVGSGEWVDAESFGGISLVETNSGTAVPSAGVLEILGTAAQGISNSASSDTITFTVSNATTAQKGVAETSTDGEAQAKASTSVILTPSNLDALDASTTFSGLIETSTDNEFVMQSSTSSAVTPANYLAGLKSCNITFRSNPIGQSESSQGSPPNTSGFQTNFFLFQEGVILAIYNIGNKTIVVPRMANEGLSIGFDLTDTEGCEISTGSNSALGQFAFVPSAAPVFMEAEITVTNPLGLSFLYVGWRVGNSPSSGMSSYQNFSTAGLNIAYPEKIVTYSRRATSPATYALMNTGLEWTAGQTKKIRVNVFTDGSSTIFIDDVQVDSPPFIPFTSLSSTIRPMIRLVQNATTSTVFLKSLKVGYQ